VNRLQDLLNLRNRVDNEIRAEQARLARVSELSARMDPVDPEEPVRDADCGTESGHKRHRRLNERPCDDCRLAHNAAERDRQQRRRQQVAA
jgi:hypothetical protein